MATVGSRTNKTLLIVVVVLLLALAAVVVWQVVGSSSYYAVSLRTGELYFGKLKGFPSFGLKNVYLLQTNPQNQQNPISVQKFTNIFWGPTDYMKINRGDVVWMTKLNPNGQLAQLLQTNPSLLPQGGQTGAAGQPQQPNASAPTPGTQERSQSMPSPAPAPAGQ